MCAYLHACWRIMGVASIEGAFAAMTKGASAHVHVEPLTVECWSLLPMQLT
jgi:hypothetical protein